MEELIKKHLEDFKTVHIASAQHYAQTGKVSGSFFMALKAMMTEYAENQNLQQPPAVSNKRFCTTDLLNAYQAGAVEMYNKIVNSSEKQTLKGLREDSQEWLKLYDK